MSTATGHMAEGVAAEYLRKQGHKILERNWRTRWCEIDIVTQKNNVVYFVEVKYRQNAAFGDGLEYITSAKLRQMTFAAELWIASHKSDCDYQLLAVAVTGAPPAVQSLEEL